MGKRKCDEQTEWVGLVRPAEIVGFARWLTKKPLEWMQQCPDIGECMRLWRDGRILVVRWDGRRTVCGRLEMALWHTYVCFKDG